MNIITITKDIDGLLYRDILDKTAISVTMILNN